MNYLKKTARSISNNVKRNTRSITNKTKNQLGLITNNQLFIQGLESSLKNVLKSSTT